MRTLDLTEAQGRVKGKGVGSQARAPIRKAIANLTTSYVLEIELDAGESMRSMKQNVTRAAKEVGRQLEYGVSPEGTLLVWLQEPKRARRIRNTKAAES